MTSQEWHFERKLITLPERCFYSRTTCLSDVARKCGAGSVTPVADGELYPPVVRLRTSAEVCSTLLLTRKGCAHIQKRWTVLLRLSRENSRTPVLSTGTCDAGPRAKRIQQNVSVDCKIVSVNTPALVDATRGKTVKYFFVLKKASCG